MYARVWPLNRRSMAIAQALPSVNEGRRRHAALRELPIGVRHACGVLALEPQIVCECVCVCGYWHSPARRSVCMIGAFGTCRGQLGINSDGGDGAPPACVLRSECQQGSPAGGSLQLGTSSPLPSRNDLGSSSTSCLRAGGFTKPRREGWIWTRRSAVLGASGLVPVIGFLVAARARPLQAHPSAPQPKPSTEVVASVCALCAKIAGYITRLVDLVVSRYKDGALHTREDSIWVHDGDSLDAPPGDLRALSTPLVEPRADADPSTSCSPMFRRQIVGPFSAVAAEGAVGYSEDDWCSTEESPVSAPGLPDSATTFWTAS